MVDDTVLAEHLEGVIRALRVLASTQRSDDARTISERAEAVRNAGTAFEEVLVERCISYTSVFAEDESDEEWNDDEEDEDDDGAALPTGTRLSVRVREDFVLVDERAFRESAAQVFAAKGPWPPRVGPEDDVLDHLGALVHEIGLHEITVGTSVAGLENAGGQTEVLVVDVALQEGEDW